MAVPIIGGVVSFLGGLLGKVIPNRSEANASQSRINEAEVAGGPPSILRLWRSFLGWVLALVFAWEIVGRGIVTTYWPSIKLPPSALEEASTLLLGMLGLGW